MLGFVAKDSSRIRGNALRTRLKRCTLPHNTAHSDTLSELFYAAAAHEHHRSAKKDATVDLQKDATKLGLKSPVATPAAVRAAYIKKAKAAHPDAGGTKQEFQNIQAAYERLGTQRRHQAAVDARYYARRPNDIIDRINHRLSRSVTRSRK